MKQNSAVICLSPINGGMELASIKIAKLLINDTHVHFIAKDNSYISKQKNDLEASNIQLHTIDFKSNLSFSLILEARKIFIKNNIKNIIFLGASEMKSLYFSTLGLDINFIVRQGTTKSTPKKDFFHRLFYSKVNYFVGNSEYIVKNILKILPIPPKAQIRRIYASVTLDKDISYKDYNKKIELIHVGRITKGKGQLEAIQACCILKEQNIDFTLRFIGDVHDKEYYQTINTFLDHCSYKQNVEFVGFSSDIKQYYQKSDIFIFPTYGEGMSNAIIEAISFGLVPIIYNNTSTPEFKNLGFYVHLTTDNNVENLKNILNKVVKNIEVEKQLSKQNHTKALEIFSSNREKNEYLEMLV